MSNELSIKTKRKQSFRLCCNYEGSPIVDIKSTTVTYDILHPKNRFRVIYFILGMTRKAGQTQRTKTTEKKIGKELKLFL